MKEGIKMENDDKELNKNDFCSCVFVHKENVEKVSETMPNTNLLDRLSELFKILGDLTRVKILCALSISELCVCDLTVLLNSTQSAISHQLRILKQARLVRNRRDGRTVYYSLDDDHVRTLFEQGFSHVKEIK
jgi:DNA-binding transcriptional ArsR family regulator